MVRVIIPYENIDTLMGNPKRHESKTKMYTDKDRKALRKTFVTMYVQALCPNMKEVYNSISDNADANCITVQIWAEKDAMLVFNKLVNFNEELVFFPLDAKNILAHTEWLLTHSNPSKYEITTLLGNDLCIVFNNNDDAMRFKLSYDPTQK